MNGFFSEEALERFAQLAAQRQTADFSEEGTYDFTRCVRPNGSTYGTRGKCRKGTEAGPFAYLPEKTSSFPKSVSKLEKLATGKLPEDKAKRKALYDGAQKRLGVLGDNPLNPKQQNDGHEPERKALRKLLGRLNDEFNAWGKVTEKQMRRAVGTVE